MAFDTDGAPNLSRLREFVGGLAELVDAAGADETRILLEGARRLGALVASDDWLPAAFAEADAEGPRTYLLHCDSRRRFSVVSLAWAPGQGTPAHDHTVWGLVGVLRGAEIAQDYTLRREGLVPQGPPRRLETGAVEAVSPRLGDIHRVVNAHPDRTSVSIHVYGGDIGAIPRHAFDPSGQVRAFRTVYANGSLPNLWGAPA